MECEICLNNLQKKYDSSFFKAPVYYCSNCNHYTTYEKKEEMEKKLRKLYENEFWDYETTELASKTQFTDEESLGKKRDWISQYEYCKKFLSGKKRILEIGSGRGQNLYFFENRGHQVFGVEPDKKNVDFSNKVLRDGKVIKSFIENVQFDEKFDIIWINHVLEHIINPKDFLKKIKNHLQKGGIIFLAVPDCENELILNASINKTPTINHFSTKSISKMTEDEFHIVSIDCFRPAKKMDGIMQKIFHNHPFYPRIKDECKNGKEIRVILKIKKI